MAIFQNRFTIVRGKKFFVGIHSSDNVFVYPIKCSFWDSESFYLSSKMSWRQS